MPTRSNETGRRRVSVIQSCSTVMCSLSIAGRLTSGVLTGEVLPAKFASYLYWRDAGGDAHRQFSEAFVSSVVVSSDGGILLAQSVGGTLNAGLYGSPGGLLDERDVGCGRRLDWRARPRANCRRKPASRSPEWFGNPGFSWPMSRPIWRLPASFEAPCRATALLDGVAGFLDAQAEPELEAPRMVYRATNSTRCH